MDRELGADDTVVDVLADASSSTGMETCLRPLKDLSDHALVRATGHRPGVVALNNVLHPVAVHENVVDKADTFAKGNEVKVVREEVEVDVRLLKGVDRV